MSAAGVFSQELLDFLQQGVSVTAASRDARHIPSLSKAIACRAVAPNQISLFFNLAHSGQLLADVALSQKIAVTFCLPSTLKTYQIKGDNPRQSLPLPEDKAYVDRCIRNFGLELEKAGYSADFAERFLDYTSDQLVVLTFTAAAIYEQSPGERAGQQLEFGQC
jgi:hypothetical protein